MPWRGLAATVLLAAATLRPSSARAVAEASPPIVTYRSDQLSVRLEKVALEDVLWGMHPNNDAGRVTHTLARLRAVLLRAAPRAEEVQMLTRLFVHIAHERRRQDGAGPRGRG